MPGFFALSAKLSWMPVPGKAMEAQFLTVELRDLKWALLVSQHRSLRQPAETLSGRQHRMAAHDLDPAIPNPVKGSIVRRPARDSLRKGHRRRAENERCPRHRRSANHRVFASAKFSANSSAPSASFIDGEPELAPMVIATRPLALRFRAR
jgi:hypothetical protein